MNITSVSGSELYKILSGRSYEQDHRRLSEENLSILGAKRTADRFEYSENPSASAKDSDELIDGSSVGSVLKGAFGHIDLLEIKSKISPGATITGFGFTLTENEMTSYIGGIGKRIDEAYAAGKFTEDEYKQLNDSLKEYGEALITKNERSVAAINITRENYSSKVAANGRAEDVYKSNSDPRSFQEKLNAKKAELKAQIDDYIKNVFSFDRNRVWNLIDLFRFGK